MGPEYYLPLYFQSAKLASPLRSGLLGLPFIFLVGIGGIISGLVISRTGRYNTLVWIGAFATTLGFGLLIDFKADTGLAKIIIYQSIGALGSGMLIQPAMVAIQANASQQDTATATSTLTFLRGLAEAISIVVGGVVFQSSMDIKQPELVKAGLSPKLVEDFSGRDAQVKVDQLRMITDLAQRYLVQESYAWSLRNAWILYAAVGAFSIPAAYFVGTHTLTTEHVETRTGLQDRKDDHVPRREQQSV